MLPAIVARAREYAAEAVNWLKVDGVLSSIEVVAEAQASDILAIGITVTRPTGPDRQRFDYIWEASGAI